VWGRGGRATGGELFDRILDLGHFSEKDAAKIVRQVIEGIEHMHSVGAVHRDLKPENLLMLSGDKASPEYNMVKIADFGLSALTPADDTSMCQPLGFRVQGSGLSV
jgi:serine/threonine protein kinase